MRPLHVAYDERCALCMGFARLVASLDRKRRVVVDGAHDPHHPKLKDVPDRMSALVAWDEENGRYFFGFDAVAAIVRRLPGGVCASPVLGFLRWTGWGERLYARVAARRSCAAS